MITDLDDLDDLFLWKAHRDLCGLAGAAAGGIGLVISVFGDMHWSLAVVLLAGWLARMAVTSQRRCDSIHARALAADLAEGLDAPTVMAEAA